MSLLSPLVLYSLSSSSIPFASDAGHITSHHHHMPFRYCTQWSPMLSTPYNRRFVAIRMLFPLPLPLPRPIIVVAECTSLDTSGKTLTGYVPL